MRKTLICRKCNAPFLVEGPSGKLKKTRQEVNCPYPDCRWPNPISWPSDGCFQAFSVYARNGSPALDTAASPRLMRARL